MDVNYFPTLRTARYYTLINNDIPIHTVLFVLHGYGMSAGRFLNDFENLSEPGMMIVAPEGLSRYYRKGHSGDVVASWMTRDDREHEISDYVVYLDEVYQRVMANLSAKSIVLGFSQGASTASRWVVMGKSLHDGLIVWAGEFPPEFNQGIDNKTIIWNVAGDQDEFIDLEKHRQQSARMMNLNFKVHELVFRGNHKVDMVSLKSILDDFNSVYK
jgi:predicted esterase